MVPRVRWVCAAAREPGEKQSLFEDLKIQDDICWRGHLRTKGLTGRDLLAEELPPHASLFFNDRLVRCDQGAVEPNAPAQYAHPTSRSTLPPLESPDLLLVLLLLLICGCIAFATTARYISKVHSQGQSLPWRSSLRDGASFFVAHLDAKKAR